MSDPVTPMNLARFDGYVTVTETGPHGMIALRGDFADPAFGATLGDVVGGGVPATGRAEVVGDNTICWMSPDEVLVLVPRAYVADALGRIATGLNGCHHLAADVSDMRASFRLSGPQVREVLSKLTPADLSPTAAPGGTFRRTRLAQVPAAILLRDDETADVFCFRSVARYVFDLLSTAARPGSEVHKVAPKSVSEQ